MECPDEIRVEARGLALAGLRWHRGAPCRVLATHGWLDNAATFVELAPRLPDCDIVALDLPGHGRSAHRGPGNLQHFVEYVGDVSSALDALGWEQAVLLGHSLGAGVMSCVAGTFPERVRALLLVEGLAPQSVPAASIAGSLREACAASARPHGRPAGYADAQSAIVARRKGYWPLSDAAAWHILDRALVADAAGRLHWRTDPRLRQPSAVRLTEEQVMTLLHGIRAPSLLVAASCGLFAQRDVHAARIAAIAGLQIVELGGGHHLHLEAQTAAAVAEVLGAFLARHGAA